MHLEPSVSLEPLSTAEKSLADRGTVEQPIKKIIGQYAKGEAISTGLGQ